VSIKHRDHRNSISTDDVVNRISLCSGLYCWITGILVAIFPHYPCSVTAPLTLIVLPFSVLITALAIRFGPEE